jgi:Protein of unknown function (DUF732)
VTELSDPRCKLQIDQRARVLQENEMTDDDKADDQPATAAADSEATTIVPPPTEAAPTLAYSDGPEGEEPGSWREAFGSAALPLFIAAAVLLVSLVGFWVWLKWPQQERVIVESTVTTVTTALPKWTPPVVETSTAPPVTSTVTVEATAPTAQTRVPQIAVPRSRDETYLVRLKDAEITVYDDTDAITFGHKICTAFERGASSSEIVSYLAPKSPQMTRLGVSQWVGIAVHVYCPQYSEQ